MKVAKVKTPNNLFSNYWFLNEENAHRIHDLINSGDIVRALMLSMILRTKQYIRTDEVQLEFFKQVEKKASIICTVLIFAIIEMTNKYIKSSLKYFTWELIDTQHI